MLVGSNTKDDQENTSMDPVQGISNAQGGGEVAIPDSSNIPKTTFSYKMTEELFRAAKSAPPLSPGSYWLHTLYRGPSETDQEKKVTVHYCQSKHTSEHIIQKHFMDQKVIGFDIEWNIDATRFSGPKKNVSLIQLASEERIALLHVAVFTKDGTEDLVAPSLKKIMEDPEISKVGVSIKADCTRLRKYLDINAQGLFELSHLYKLVKFSQSKDFKQINKRLVSLATQVEEHLHLPMFKGEVRSSDWSKKLNMDQITYAAADSYAGIQLYDVLDLKRKALDPVPPRPYHADQNKPIRLAEGVELSVDEATEELEPEDTQSIPVSSSHEAIIYHLPRSEVESDSDSDFEPSGEVHGLGTPSVTHAKSPSTPKPSKHPLLVTAEEHLATYRASTSSSTLTHRATPANLRAYYIWILNPELTVPEIAAVLRSPPLQTRTVAHYILEAVKLESLRYDRDRLRGVLSLWKRSGGAKGVLARRYWKLEAEVGFVDNENNK